MVKLLTIWVSLIVVFLLGALFNSTITEPEIVRVPAPYPVEKIIHTSTYNVEYIEVEKVIAAGDAALFESKAELRMFLNENRISDREGWSCVDYALRMQVVALRAGKLLSLETILYDKTRGHMGNSAVIGDKIYFVDPVMGTIELIGEADSLEIIYTEDWLKGKIGDFDWK